MKFARIILILPVLIFLMGCKDTRTFSEQAESVKITTEEVTHSASFTTEEIYAAVQDDFEWALYDNFSAYFFHFKNMDTENYYIWEATPEEIFNILKKIYNMEFCYDLLNISEDELGNIEIKIPVKIMGQEYDYCWKGKRKESSIYNYTEQLLYDADGNELFGGKFGISIKREVKKGKKLMKENALKNPDAKATNHFDQLALLKSDGYISGAPLEKGIYYLNGDSKSGKYIKISDDCIDISEDPGAWDYKTLKIKNENWIYYKCRIDGTGIHSEDQWSILYTGHTLKWNDEIYILCENP